MNLIVSEAKIGGGGLGVAAYNASARPILTRCHLAPLLRRVVLVGQPDLGKWLPETGKVFPLAYLGLQVADRDDPAGCGAGRAS